MTAIDHHKIAERYVTAIFQLAEAEGALDKTEQELAAVGDLLRESEEFRRLCLSPNINRSAQHAGLRAINEQCGLSILTGRFLLVLADNRRTNLLPEIIELFFKQLREHRGEVFAQVTSARKLKKAQSDKIAKLLQEHIGKSVIIDAQLDESILGGIRIECDGLLIDATLSGQLDRLGDELYKQIQQAA